MRIFDENDIELKEYDHSLGYLKEDERFVKHHEAIEGVEEVWHYEVVAEYPNGGKDVEKVVDVPAVEPKEAWDEYETIHRFVKFTEKELSEIKIGNLKRNLFDTDYMILKVVEGATTLVEIAETVRKRALWRKEINELEAKIKKRQSMQRRKRA